MALVVGHHDDGPIAQRIGHQRDTDAGIARGSFDHSAAGLQVSTRFRIANDIKGSPVLHACAWIGEFAFPEDVAAGFRARPFEAHERRVADEIERVLAYWN